MGWTLKKAWRHPGSAFAHGGKKLVKEVLNQGVSVGVGASGGKISANAKVGKVPVANVPIKGASKPAQNKVPQKPIPKNPNVGGCYGVQPKQITTNYPTITNETPATLHQKMTSLVGSYVGESQHCVALVKALFSNLGATPNWTRGVKVKGNAALKTGTPIATFGTNGNYLSEMGGTSHAAIFRRFVDGGIEVYDQSLGQPVRIRVIRYKNGQGKPSNDGDQFYVINKKPLQKK